MVYLKRCSLVLVAAGVLVAASVSAEPLAFEEYELKSKNFETDLMESPPGGFFVKFQHGPNSTMAVYKTAEGKGRSLPVRINRHNEETGLVTRGSVLFKAGYAGEFTKVLRVGDTIVIPRCVPHSGIFGWDNNEETVLQTTFTEKYAEYGPDTATELPKEFTAKIVFDPESGVAASKECAAMTGAPAVTWSIQDMQAYTEE